MRGPTRIGLLAVSLVCLFALMVASAFADADDQLRDKEKGTVLRDVKAKPENQPDAIEFVNNGTAKLKTSLGTIECTELEFGSTVLSNALGAVELALPFGVAEGDNCSITGVGAVPTYFDTTAEGAVGNAANKKVARITVADTGVGTPVVATLHDLKFSQSIGGKFCTGELNEVSGTVTNSSGPFVEEKTPNLEAKFEKTIKVSGEAGCPTEATLTVNFFLETPSTMTDTAWFES
jgi:hypothetical protein